MMGEDICLCGYEYDHESEDSLTQPRQKKEVSLSKREKAKKDAVSLVGGKAHGARRERERERKTQDGVCTIF